CDLGRRQAVSFSGNVHVSSSCDKYSHGVHIVVGGFRLRELERLVQGYPADIVHVVGVDPGLQKAPDDACVSALGGTDEPGAIPRVQTRDIGAVLEGELEQWEIALAGRDEVRALHT